MDKETLEKIKEYLNSNCMSLIAVDDLVPFLEKLVINK